MIELKNICKTYMSAGQTVEAQQALVGAYEWREALRLRQFWCEGNFAR